MIVVGFKYMSRVREIEHTLVGRGNSKHLDALLKLAPHDHSRARLAKFFAPLLEGKEPRSGVYEDIGSVTMIMWWKNCEMMP